MDNNNNNINQQGNWNNLDLHDQLPFTALLQNYPPLQTLFEEDENNHQPADHQEEEEEEEELGAMKETMYKIAAMQPVDIDPATICKPKRRNVRISDDPQSVAARHRREKISEKIRILQRLVPSGTKMDTASMLDEAIRYLKFLKRQIRLLQSSNQYHHHQLLSAANNTTVPDHQLHVRLYNNNKPLICSSSAISSASLETTTAARPPPGGGGGGFTYSGGN